jgi:hypothetical protein
VNINELVGKRLRKAITRAEFPSGDAFGKSLTHLGGWNRQSVSEACSGRRVFRVGELVGLALAADVPAAFLLDARGEGVRQVELADGYPPVTAAELYAAFSKVPSARSIPTAVQAIHARKFLRQVRDSLKMAEDNAATVDRFLRLIQPAEEKRR